MIVPLAASAAPPAGEPGNPELLATLPGGAGSGSAVGPGGSLYVTQPATGEIWRVDPESGEKALYASGLPRRFGELPFGGVMDVAFIGSAAYALVSVVGSVFPDDLFACHPRTVGIYRVNGPRARRSSQTSARSRARTRRPDSRSPSQWESSSRWRRIAADSS